MHFKLHVGLVSMSEMTLVIFTFYISCLPFLNVWLFIRCQWWSYQISKMQNAAGFHLVTPSYFTFDPYLLGQFLKFDSHILVVHGVFNWNFKVNHSKVINQNKSWWSAFLVPIQKLMQVELPLTKLISPIYVYILSCFTFVFALHKQQGETVCKWT